MTATKKKVVKKKVVKKDVIEKEVTKKEKVVPTHTTYKNVTRRNVFTSGGTVHAGDEVTIPTDEGAITKGLEPCQK